MIKRLSIAIGVIGFVALAAILIYWAQQEWIKDEPNTITLNTIVLAFVALLLLTSLALSRLQGSHWLLKWFGSLNTEFAGALILTSLILFLVTIPAERKAEHQLKQQLIREMGGQDNGLALRAVKELGAYGWLTDGALKEANLTSANLAGVDLWDANLQGATLANASLQGATLAFANLAGVDLGDANLAGADLTSANLAEARLRDANLAGRT